MHKEKLWIRQLGNDQRQYGWLAITLHWLSAVLVIGLFALGVWMVTLSYYSQWYNPAPSLHKSLGVLFAVILTLRLIWRCMNQQPLIHGAKIERLLAHIGHYAIYAFLFAIVISGYFIVTAEGAHIEVFGIANIPGLSLGFERQADIAGWWHQWLSYFLGGLLCTHIAAAVKHQFFDKDGTISRMLGRLTN